MAAATVAETDAIETTSSLHNKSKARGLLSWHLVYLVKKANEHRASKRKIESSHYWGHYEKDTNGSDYLFHTDGYIYVDDITDGYHYEYRVDQQGNWIVKSMFVLLELQSFT